MPRHPGVEFPGAIYHITIRGNGRQNIFGDDYDRERFLQRMADSVAAYGIRLYLFALMNNHVADVMRMKSGVSAGVQVRRAVALKAGNPKVAKLIATIEDALEGQRQENQAQRGS